ncbi:MAG TPA: PAS domain-containing protein [Aliidongia sp.]|uniref:PAS domain-containing protein n=1 Tax=Aliidongia sp. TaxID=1914230 RepID=UPI002DDD552B|nr:PAS domain-containing protein [Aliidongia sp.]HEV2673601.1 PAS domain-containing protein [Aliidongia sp.]
MDADSLRELAESIKNPRLRRLLDDWLRWRGERLMPSRRDFLPEEIRYLLGNVILHEVASRDPLRFRYRLIGSLIVARRGFDFTGRYLDELPSTDVRDVVMAINERVTRERRPLLWRFEMNDLDHRMRHCEVLSLPLSADGVDVNIILAAQVFNDEERTT